HRRGVFVQVGKYWSQRFAPVQLLGRLWILGVHVHDEVRVFGEQRHLTLRIAPIRTVWVRLDQLSDGKALGGFGWGNGEVLAHERRSLGLKNGAGFEKRLD